MAVLFVVNGRDTAVNAKVRTTSKTCAPWYVVSADHSYPFRVLVASINVDAFDQKAKSLEVNGGHRAALDGPGPQFSPSRDDGVNLNVRCTGGPGC
jgi:hypothetical protein